MTAGPTFDPFAPELRANPYPLYHRMRTEDPVHWSDTQGAFLLTRYADCVEILRDPRSSSDDVNATQSPRRDALDTAPMSAIGVRPMLFADPPDHTRLRGLVNKAFTPRTVEAMRPHIESIVDQLLDGVAGRDRLDIIADIGFPLPVIVIAEMLGVPAEDREQLKGWSRDLAHTIDPNITNETAERASMAGLMFVNYLNGLIDERRREPREDLLSRLIAVEDEGVHLTHEELLVNCILLFIAGHETTQNLIGNGMLALLRHPDQLAKLRDDPSLAKGAVEEMLRYDGPVQLTARHFIDDIEVGGHKIEKGQTAVLLLAAADRDPAQFPDPDTFDITRADAARHIAFGNGVHYCLGAPLAKVEAQIAVNALLRRFPGLALAVDEPEYSDTFTLRGMAALPVSV